MTEVKPKSWQHQVNCPACRGEFKLGDTIIYVRVSEAGTIGNRYVIPGEQFWAHKDCAEGNRQT